MTQSDQQMIDAERFDKALMSAGIEYAGMSWGGFNLFGDTKSIDEAKRMLHAAGALPAFRERIVSAESSFAQASALAGEMLGALIQILPYVEGYPCSDIRGGSHKIFCKCLLDKANSIIARAHLEDVR